MADAGYRVILRPREDDITGQLVALEGSPIRTLEDLRDNTVGFPSRGAFVGYVAPMDHLLRQGIAVKPVFGGNQEGIMEQLRMGKVLAAGVNNRVMAQFALREGVTYRVLWESQPFPNIPIAAHPRVPRQTVERVKQTIAGMKDDPEGRELLAASAAVIKQEPPYGFIPASQEDYNSYINFYRSTLVTDIE